MTHTLPAPAPTPTTTGARRRLFGLSLGLWRVTLLLLTVAVASQPVTIGLYLSGAYPMVGWHGTLGSAAAAVALLVATLSVGYAAAGGRPWVVPASVALFLATGVQVGQGYARSLGTHVPLGVAVVTGAVLLTAWSWTRSAGRYRERRLS